MALTPEELRQRIPNWSLESDGQLLQYMISIAKNLEEKCTSTRDSLNSLMLQVDQTELKLANATNQFSAVEQVKFVENRVEEDDESFYGLRRRRQQQQEVEKGKNKTSQEQNGEQSLDDLIQLAVERSIEGMYNSYDKVTLDLADSDTSDSEETYEGIRKNDTQLSGGKASIMRAIPRYPFIDRALPHVIGSKEWQNKWHVGLIDSDDESSSERKEEYSESSSETDDDGGMFPSQPNSKNHTPSESESSIWGADVSRKRAPSMDPSITGDDGSSVYSYASSSKPRTLPTHPVRGMAPMGSSLKPPSLFPEEPPEEISSVKSRGAKGLFDDSPEEEEPVPMPRQTVPHSHNTAPFFKGTVHQPARKMVNLFDDEPPPPQEQIDCAPEPKKSINLFIESEDEEEAIENVQNNNTQRAVSQTRTGNMAPKSSVNASGPPATNPRTMTKLVDELNNNFQKQQPHSKPEMARRNIPDRSSQFSNQRPAVSNLFDAEPPPDEFDQFFSASNPSVKPTHLTQPAVLPQPAFRTTVEKKTVNLFADDDDDEDDDDGIAVGSNEKQSKPVRSPFISPNRIALPKQPERRVTSKKKSIFDDSDSEAEKDDPDSALFGGSGRERTTVSKPVSAQGELSVKPPQTVVKSIFSDSSEAEDDEDALFGHSSNIVKNKLDALKRNGIANSPATVTHTKPSEPRLPKNEPIAKDKSKSSSKSKSLFDEDSDDGHTSADSEGLFSSGILNKLSTTKPPTEPLKVSLFDDHDDDATDDDKPVDRGRTAKGSRIQGDNNKKHETAKKSPNAASDPKTYRSGQTILTDEDLFAGHKQIPTTQHTTDVKMASVIKTNPKRETTTGITGIDNNAMDKYMMDRDPLSIAGDPVEQKNAATLSPVVTDSDGKAGSIRNIILKKSIFHSDSESEEDDYIHSSSPRTGPMATAETAVADQATMGDDDKCDTEGAQFGDGSEHKTKANEQINGTPFSGLNKLREKEVKDPLSEEEKSSDMNMHSPAPTTCDDAKKHITLKNATNDPDNISSERTQENTSAENNILEETEKAVENPIFEDTPSENEDEADVNMFVKELQSSISSLDQKTERQSGYSDTVPSTGPSNVVAEEKPDKLDQIALLEKLDGDGVSEITLKRSLPGLQLVQEEENCDIPELAFADSIARDIMIPVDHEFNRSTPTKEENLPEQPSLGMIANDIDYFLRTSGCDSSNQPTIGDRQPRPVTKPPVKSETKSALNFNPIGLFDDVPPPDDDGADVDAYAHEQQKHFNSVGRAPSLPPVDDSSGYPTESQSLNFEPNGSGGDNNRTRYLFDDEPPPDEADNSRTSANYSPPFRGAVSKALFEQRQMHLDAHASLPPMSQDAPNDQQRPKVKKLTKKLSINVAALLPGARRLPLPTATVVKTKHAGETGSDHNVFDSQDAAVSNAAPTHAPADVSNGEKLADLNKGRARIPTKRKPPSRQTLRAAVPSQKVRKDGDFGEAADRVVLGSEGKMLHIEAGVTEACLTKPHLSPDLPYDRAEEFEKRDISKMDPLIDRLSASVRTTRTVRPDGNETQTAVVKQIVPKQPVFPAQQKPKSIFGDSDSNDDGDSDNLFSNITSKVPSIVSAATQSRKTSAAAKSTRSIFGSDEDEDDDGMGDIFGGKRSGIVGQLKPKAMEAGTRQSSMVAITTSSVKPPPPKGTTSLFGDDDNDGADDDDLFGSKTKSNSNASGTKSAKRPITAPLMTTTTKATTTRAMKDPLADLLDS